MPQRGYHGKVTLAIRGRISYVFVIISFAWDISLYFLDVAVITSPPLHPLFADSASS